MADTAAQDVYSQERLLQSSCDTMYHMEYVHMAGAATKIFMCSRDCYVGQGHVAKTAM